jgi:hypothetical protein
MDTLLFCMCIFEYLGCMQDGDDVGTTETPDERDRSSLG